MTILHFNDGAKGVLSVLSNLNLKARSYILRCLESSDFDQIHYSKRKSLPQAKTQRKNYHQAKRKNICRLKKMKN